jgi:hypothetical protein
VTDADAPEGPTPATPIYVVRRGHPSDEEVAALTAVLSMLGSAGGPPSDRDGRTPAASGWSAYWRLAGAPLAPGNGAWRASGRP